MLGFDVKSVAADGILPNGATSATVNLTTSNDTYAPGVVTTSINLFSPVFPPQSKTVTDVTPSQPVGAGVGDTLEYTIDLPNTGGDGAAKSVISDALPPDVTYVAGLAPVRNRYRANGPLGAFTNSHRRDRATTMASSSRERHPEATGRSGYAPASAPTPRRAA